jgi:O-antigen ligase
VDRLSSSARIGCIAAAVTATVLLVSMFGPRPGYVIVAIVWSVGLLSAVRPFDGLLVVSGIGPVMTALAIVLGSNHVGVRFPEALVLAFIAGASARRSVSRDRFAVRPFIGIPAAILVAAAVASAVISATVLGIEQPATPQWAGVPIPLITEFLTQYNTAVVAVQFAEGLVLFLLAADLCARHAGHRLRVLAMMVAGASGAAFLNIARLATAALSREHPIPAFASYLANIRVNVQFGDWNAAGSFFALTLLIALTFLARRRWSYALAVGTITPALWITGSRSALAAVLGISAAGGLVLALRSRDWRQKAAFAVGLAMIAGAALLAWHYYPKLRNDPATFSIRTRLELWQAAVSMMTTQPLFGIGLGGFYVQSHRYAAAMLDSIGRPYENAHNYFVQVLAELGIPGLVLFLAVIGLSLREAWRAGEAWWTTGLVAFLLTCLVGHPLVVPEVSYPFWIALAAAAGTAGAAQIARHSNRATGSVMFAVILLLGMTLPMRLRDGARHANTENVSMGLSAWQAGPGGVRFRWAEPRAMFFVPSAARGVRIPLRGGPDAPDTIAVRVLHGGREAERIVLHRDEDWRAVRLVRNQLGTDPDFVRIDLEFDAPVETGRPSRILMVGQPTITWVQ